MNSNIRQRDSKGRFSNHTIAKIGIVVALLVMATAIIGEKWVTREVSASNMSLLATPAFASETAAAKIAKTKDELVESLAKECETKKVTEPDAAIILDANNQMSIGAFMYQIKTIQQYEKSLFSKDVTRVEAIQIAINHSEAAALTKAILFQVPGGWQNWSVCAKSLNLPIQIELLGKLS